MAKQAVTENSEITARTLKNFRTSPDVENFYRFVHENGLRADTKLILEKIVAALKPKKKRKKRKSKVLQ